MHPPARVVVVSDLHIGPGGPLDSFRAGRELTGLVRSLDPPSTVLVVAGDLLDTLQVPHSPRVLDLEDAPGRVRRLLGEVRGTPWGAALFAALGRFVEAGGRWVVLPGNHDLELYHPRTKEPLCEAVGVAPDHPGVILHNALEAWRLPMGRREVVVGHGHLGDPWNRVRPEAIHGALSRGKPSLPLPPGSLLVLETVNAFKRALDPATGAPRFPFVDLLKPEGPWVPLLLLAFDPGLALAHLPGVAGHGGQALLRALAGRLRDGRTLAPPAGAAVEDGDLDVAGELAAAIGEALTPAERAAPRALLARVEAELAGAAPGRPGSLAPGGAAGLLLRAAHRLWHDGGGFYDPGRLGALDRAIVAEHLPEGAGPRVVVAGHTHAAREARLPGDRVYLNTGTWTDLLKVPAEADAEVLAAWAEDLRHRRSPRLARLTYAEVTAHAAGLRWWPDGEAAPSGGGGSS